jgi:carboxyl-terminal processing protease
VVTDQGGVMPDIEIRELASNELIEALQQNQLIFDFATQYYYDHTHADVSGFALGPNTLKRFNDFVSQSGFSFETNTEKALREALTRREDVIFTDEIEADFRSLLAAVEKQKMDALENHSVEIKKLLEDEIVKRYFYREGLFEYYLDHDPSILAARELLSNPSKYQATLQ